MSVDAPKATYNGRAYGMDIRVEKEEGTLSVYEAPPFSEAYRFVKRGPADEIISHCDVSGSMRKFFGRWVFMTPGLGAVRVLLCLTKTFLTTKYPLKGVTCAAQAGLS